MSNGEVSPPIAKKQGHDVRSEMDVLFSLGPVHVFGGYVAQIMEKERCPKAEIPRETKQNRPSDRNEDRMDKETVRSEENALGTDSHKSPLAPCYTMMGPRDG